MTNYMILWIRFLKIRIGQSVKNYNVLFHG